MTAFVLFGVILTLFALSVPINLSIGLITPPFGSIMFVVCGISRCSIAQFTREVGPFMALLILALGLTTYIPSLVRFFAAWLLGP